MYSRTFYNSICSSYSKPFSLENIVLCMQQKNYIFNSLMCLVHVVTFNTCSE